MCSNVIFTVLIALIVDCRPVAQQYGTQQPMGGVSSISGLSIGNFQGGLIPNSPGMPNSLGITNSPLMTNPSGMPNSFGITNSPLITNPFGITNSPGITNPTGIPASILAETQPGSNIIITSHPTAPATSSKPASVTPVGMTFIGWNKSNLGRDLQAASQFIANQTNEQIQQKQQQMPQPTQPATQAGLHLGRDPSQINSNQMSQKQQQFIPQQI